jgi:hypothetical protein
MLFDLFIDTNIYLSFYRLTKSDNDALKKIFVLDHQKEFRLLSTEQVIDEFNRNRSKVISESKNVFDDLRLPEVPSMINNPKEVAEYLELRKKISASHRNIQNLITEKSKEKKLFVDELIELIFENSHRSSSDSDIVTSASNRIDRGNPPGKKGSLGDAINWQILLKVSPNDRDLVIISQDKDYRDPLTGELNSYLCDEWKKAHSGTITLYENLQGFLSKKFPDVEIQAFREIARRISLLDTSISFQQTHTAIAGLQGVNFYTVAQANEIVRILSRNDQVKWIFDDMDVRNFFSDLNKNFGAKLELAENRYLVAMLDRKLGDELIEL